MPHLLAFDRGGHDRMALAYAAKEGEQPAPEFLALVDASATVSSRVSVEEVFGFKPKEPQRTLAAHLSGQARSRFHMVLSDRRQGEQHSTRLESSVLPRDGLHEAARQIEMRSALRPGRPKVAVQSHVEDFKEVFGDFGSTPAHGPGRLRERIVGYASRHMMDCLVIGVKPLSLIERYLVDGKAMYVSKNAPMSVLLVPSDPTLIASIQK
eukprot:gene7586-18_t